MTRPPGVRRFALLALLSLAVVVASAWLGWTHVTWTQVAHPPGLTSEPSAAPNIFWQFRVPRVLLAACAGAALAVCGVVFQAVFRNPLAEPYTLGVASGASLAAAIGFLAGWGGTTLLGLPRLSLLAFGGALAAIGIVALMARLRPGHDMARLLLAGVCVAYMSSAGILLVTYLADRAITNEIVTWMMGSLATYRPRAAAEIAFILVPVLLYFAANHAALDLLAFGPHLAAARGVAVSPLVGWSLLLVGVLTAAVVANCGPLGFVGLMVPHIARAIVGGRTLPLLVAAMCIGAAFLCLCDGLARSVAVFELPVGVVTNMLGAAFFFYLLATRDVLHTRPAH